MKLQRTGPAPVLLLKTRAPYQNATRGLVRHRVVAQGQELRSSTATQVRDLQGSVYRNQETSEEMYGAASDFRNAVYGFCEQCDALHT